MSTPLTLSPATALEACCPTSDETGSGPVDDIRDLARRIKALSDPTRLQLLQLIAAHSGQTACICELTEPLKVTQPTVSHHMRLLVEAGLVTREQRGKWAYYSLRPSAMADLGQQVASLASDRPDQAVEEANE